jgi:cobalt-zinc-cadmium efflux system outer membrane protein
MKTKSCSRILAAGLLVTALSAVALSQSASEATPRQRSGPLQEMSGLVLKEQPVRPTGPAQASSYAQFIDPANGFTAEDLVRYALTHNGELLAARHMIAEARGRLRQAGLKPDPMVDTSYQKDVTSSDNNFNLMAELPLELGGRREARVAVANRELEMREAEAADFERRLAAEVRMKYADVVAAARNLRFTEDLLLLTRDSHRLVEARVERGKSAPLEQNLVSVEVGQVNVIRINFEGKAEVAILELKRTIGMPPDEPLRLKGEFDPDLQPAPISEALLHALASRPDLAANRAAEQLALAQIEQARAEGKIDASIFASYMRQNMGYPVSGFNSAGQLAPVHGIFHYVGFGVKLTLPVRNKNQGLIEAAQASMEAARNRRQFAEIVVRNEVASAYARFERARQALSVYRDGVRNQAQINLDVIRQTYVLGQKSLLDFIAEQRRYIEVETGFTEVLKEYYNSVVEIKRAAASPVPTV